MSQENRIELIINPTSGYGSAGVALRTLRRAIASRGWELVEHITSGPGDATRIARQVGSEARAVIAFGGDGTVREVADGLTGSPVPLLVAPAGTENLLAKFLGLDNQASTLMPVLEHRRIIPMDLACVNGRSFHTILGVGFDAEVVRRVTANREGHITHLSYALPILRALGSYKHPVLKIQVDDEDLFEGKAMAFVANSSRYGGGLGICPIADPSDGKLDLVVLPCRHRKDFYLWAWQIARGKLLEHPKAIHRTFRTARIETSPNETCEIDGDIGPAGPLEISLHEKPIQLLVPDDYCE